MVLTVAYLIDIMENWMMSRQLEITHHETEVVVVNNRMFEQ